MKSFLVSTYSSIFVHLVYSIRGVVVFFAGGYQALLNVNMRICEQKKVYLFYCGARNG